VNQPHSKLITLDTSPMKFYLPIISKKMVGIISPILLVIICYQKNRKCVVWNHLRSSTTWLSQAAALVNMVQWNAKRSKGRNAFTWKKYNVGHLQLLPFVLLVETMWNDIERKIAGALPISIIYIIIYYIYMIISSEIAVWGYGMNIWPSHHIFAAPGCSRGWPKTQLVQCWRLQFSPCWLLKVAISGAVERSLNMW
jgi:hypothetical protein